jgi:tRNA1Val (adenine37-N6)-methyltransferase
MRIIQREDAFRFGTDSVLLAHFALPFAKKLAGDFGTGNCVMPLLMAAHGCEASFDAIEIQPDIADMARRSVELNGLTDRIRVHTADLRDAKRFLPVNRYDLVVCNPPFFEKDGSSACSGDARNVARHAEGTLTEEIMQSAKAILNNRGRLCVVYPAAKFLELAFRMRAHSLEPKRARLVLDRMDKAPKLILVEAAKSAKPSLEWMPPLILRKDDGSWSDEWMRIYRA